MTSTVSARHITATALQGIAIVSGACLAYPVVTAPSVLPYLGLCVETSATVALAGGAVLGCGYVWHRLCTWAADRPQVYSPAPAMQFASTRQSPELAEVAQMERQEVKAAQGEPLENDAEWRLALCNFTVAARYGGFGWRAMCSHVGRQGWTDCLEILTGAGILTPGRGNKPADYAPGQSGPSFRAAVRRHALELAFPDCPAPRVTI